MTATLAAQTSVGEAVTFWILGPLALIAAVGMVLARNAVHAALMLVGVMFCLSAFYFVQDAPFLGAVQIIVYTGAIMMLFLFVLMLVGVDVSDSLVETLRGQRAAAGLVGLLFTGMLVVAIGSATLDAPAAEFGAAYGNEGVMDAIARTLFTKYLFAFEVTSALLITAALGAMVLAHKERAEPRPTQRELSRRRFEGTHPTPLPGPGVFARGDSISTPARLPDGSDAPDSISPVLDDPATPAPSGPARS